MVIHDEIHTQAWTQQRDKQKRQESHHPMRHLSVVAVQSIACCVAVVLVLLMRVAGGDAYHSLQQNFHKALARNEWVSALALLWDGNPLEDPATAAKTEVKGNTFTEETSAPLTETAVAVAATPPLSSGTLTSAYGDRIHPISGAKEFHTGVDIAAPTGTALAAMYDGEVVEVGEDDCLGRYIRLNHGGALEILYGHCAEVTVQPGTTVQAGDKVALVGSTGVSTGSHVHIRVSVEGTACDPATLVPLERYA